MPARPVDASSLQLFELAFVLLVEADERGDHDRNENDDEPGAVGELCDGDDDERRGTTAAAPTPLTKSP